jgi:type II secretory pathway component PulF
MRNGLWTKGFVIGIIMLFVGAGVLPSVSGNVVNLNTASDNITQIIIGVIKDKTLVSPYAYGFTCIIVIFAVFYQGSLMNSGLLINQETNLTFTSKIGIFSNHIICGMFFLPY